MDSKMQVLLDKAESAWKQGQADTAFHALIEAIKLLSRGMKQTMGDVSRSPRDDIPIGKS